MYTSYYNFYKNKDNGVSISLDTPLWFKGKKFPELAPKEKYIYYFRNGKMTVTDFIYEYLNILIKLDRFDVYDKLGGYKAVLLCHEPSNLFCHRHILAYWLSYNLLGDTIYELNLKGKSLIYYKRVLIDVNDIINNAQANILLTQNKIKGGDSNVWK